MVSLESERLVLREFREEDLKAIHRYASDPEVVRFMPWGPNTEEDTAGFLRRAIEYQSKDPRTHYEIAITLKEGGHLIGGCGIRASNLELREGDFGYCLNRDHWGRGYATETALRLLRYGFEDLKLHRLYATCDPENIGSRRVLEKIGMRREGHLRENVRVRGRWRDSLLYAILDKEWKKSVAHK
jgi:RimJ/RimL family protein N-acetyltransferase